MVILFGRNCILLTVLWTVFKSFEYSPDELKKFTEHSSEHETNDYASAETHAKIGKSQVSRGIIITILGIIATYLLSTQNLTKELYIFTLGATLFGVLQLLAGFLQTNGNYKKWLRNYHQ